MLTSLQGQDKRGPSLGVGWKRTRVDLTLIPLLSETEGIFASDMAEVWLGESLWLISASSGL